MVHRSGLCCELKSVFLLLSNGISCDYATSQPLRDASGELRYFLGHQFNVSSKTSDLSYLLSDALDEKTESDDSPMVAEQQSQAQEAMKSHISVQLGAAERRVG